MATWPFFFKVILVAACYQKDSMLAKFMKTKMRASTKEKRQLRREPGQRRKVGEIQLILSSVTVHTDSQPRSAAAAD